MAHLLPRSLFGRLVLIFVGGMLIAQAASVGVGALEHAQVERRSHGQVWAQRVADIVSLLNALSAAEREHMARALSHRRLQVTVAASALVPATAARGGNQVSEFRDQLADALGRRPFRFDAVHRRHGPLQWVTQVRLNDSSWVRFRYSPRPAHPGWPARWLIGLGIFLAVMLVIVLIAVRWVTQPLEVLAQAADALGEDIDRAPMAERGPTEVARAARAFNRMQRRLRETLADRMRLLAAISHDLKTPITRLRLRAEMLDDDDLRMKFTRDLEEMEALADAALDFMRGGKPQESVRAVDVQALVESVQRDLVEQGHEVRVEGRTLAPYMGRPVALRRCIDNLVGNALKYGTAVRVVIEDQAALLRLRVLDEGPGIPEAELSKVFEPFYRLELSRNRSHGGSGLGLGIARNVAGMHGGTLTLRNRASGGLEAVLELPRQV